MSANEEVTKVVAAVLGVDADSTTSRDIEPKWDSLKHVEVMFSIEDSCGVRFSQEQLADLRSVGEIVVAVEQIRGS